MKFKLNEFSLSKHLPEVTQRTKGDTLGTLIFLLIIIGCFAAFVFTLVLGLSDRSERIRIFNEGVRVNGTVIQEYSDDDTARIKYAFRVSDGTLITGDARNTTSLAIENDIEIVYDPANPSKNFSVQEGVPSVWDTGIGVSSLFTFSGLFFIWLFIIVRHQNNKHP